MVNKTPSHTRAVNIGKLAPDVINQSDFVNVGRPHKWGNPIERKQISDLKARVAAYRAMVARELERKPHRWAELRDELFGKQLGCYCKPAPCHADVLAEYAEIANNLFLCDVAAGTRAAEIATVTVDADRLSAVLDTLAGAKPSNKLAKKCSADLLSAIDCVHATAVAS